MKFGRDMQCLVDCILATDPELGPTFMRKVDLADAYIHIWVQLADVPAVAFLVPREKESDLNLIGFHLYIPMGYVESAPFFCVATKRMIYLSLNTLYARVAFPDHPLEIP